MALPSIPTFSYDGIPEGYYHEIFESGSRIRKAWHVHKFDRICGSLPAGENLAILDVGCFAGTFLSLLPQSRFSRQVGVDIIDRQIGFARKKFGSSFREFITLPTPEALQDVPGDFDCITLIEVIEHLYPDQIRDLVKTLATKLRVGGTLVLSTPNYHSAWPFVEFVVNRMSEVSYEEQHVTRFGYFNVDKKWKQILGPLANNFKLEWKTTTHFASPFLAGLSPRLAHSLSSSIPHHRWHLPFGNLLLLKFLRVSV